MTNQDDSGLHHHPTTRGFTETANWPMKGAQFSFQTVFHLSRVLVGIGLLLEWVTLYGEALPRLWMWVIPVGYGLFLSVIQIWSKRFADQTVSQNHDWSFGISFGMSSMFWVLLSVEFLRRSIRWS